MFLNRSQQVAYVANIAFACALADAAESADGLDAQGQKIRNKLIEGPFKYACEATVAALQFRMQQPFVDFAKKLLDSVDASSHWHYLMDFSHAEGQRTALYLLYQESVGAGVGFWDSTNKWADLLADPDDTPRKDLQDWAKNFTTLVKYREAPLVAWPLRYARPQRSAP